MLNGPQRQRLAIAVKNLRNEPNWRVIHQFFIGESAEDEPDMGGMREFVLARLTEVLDEDIKDAMAVRARERGAG